MRNAPTRPKKARAKPDPNAILQPLKVAEENADEVKRKRRIPALISGGIHLLFLIIVLIVYFTSADDASDEHKYIGIIDTSVTTKLSNAEIINPDVGFDAELEAAIDNTNEADLNVEAIVLANEPIGRPENEFRIPEMTFAPPGARVPSKVNPGELPSPEGEVVEGEGGEEGVKIAEGMAGRSGATKDALLRGGGGNGESESAVALGLWWLARQQQPDGSWIFDGTSRSEIDAATGICLLPFLAAGQTHLEGDYQDTVANGLRFLMRRQNPDGSFNGLQLYAHAIPTISLCEAYGMTRQANIGQAAQKAIDYAVACQDPNGGGWRYKPLEKGDTSVTGWFVQALKSAKMAGLRVPDRCFQGATVFLNSVTSDGAAYGYTDPTDARPSMTAVALLCREYLGWNPDTAPLQAGVAYLKQRQPPSSGLWDIYYYYYATQVVYFYGGPDWHSFWNPKMRDLLVDRQEKAGVNRGSWKADETLTGTSGGRLLTTCLALLTLEVYYRYLPLYKRSDGTGVGDLEQ